MLVGYVYLTAKVERSHSLETLGSFYPVFVKDLERNMQLFRSKSNLHIQQSNLI